jgi:predicted enzyme related to lactoylglutathione lyase
VWKEWKPGPKTKVMIVACYPDGHKPVCAAILQETAIMTDLHSLPSPRLCYLEIPATDPHKSAEFYKNVFGWNIRRGDTDRPSFDDPSGVSGAFVTYLKPAQEHGILPSIWVEDMEAFVAKIEAHGGEIVERPRPDEPGGTCFIATFRDPAGNRLRLYWEPAG